VSESAVDDQVERQAFQRLEGAVGRLLEELATLKRRSDAAEARVAEVEALLRRFTKGTADPADLERRTRALETENEELRTRIEEAREGVDRLLARIRFLEEQS
jgi:predicted RNase H-like nuclease (RuvC/YqgF family)